MLLNTALIAFFLLPIHLAVAFFASALEWRTRWLA
jgi:hypothetical protein